MNLSEYQALARRTMKELPYVEHVEHMTLGINGELGEIADAVKKHFIYGKALDLVNLAEEGGDCFWYAVGYLPELRVDPLVMASAYYEGVTLGTVWQGSAAQLVTQVQAQVATATVHLLEYDQLPPEDYRVAFVRVIGKNLGMLFGYFELDLSTALTANIQKLAKRYGDKYSDYAALNRDTAAERVVLESNLQSGASA